MEQKKGASLEERVQKALGDAPAVAPTVWSSAAGAPIPEDAHEYAIRKALNDAAFQNLNYVPYCSTMPVPRECPNPKFAWRRK